MPKNKYACRVCGYIYPVPPYGDDGDSPTYNYCPCCGVEYGYQDFTPEGVRMYREEWLSRGRLWHDPKEEPENWDWIEQSKNIPDDF
ncbi:hypothetical protein GCM10008957_04510 [Deinococcus ruber]|uniref:Rubredoxin-like domain-containing protein n=1 Tax=Deinococcus ruber TaxID=1848197 RepID=A0A918BX44_9DEIO|nr:hypothetical protein GCM10008957_04510 [Deinococcus ruber]